MRKNRWSVLALAVCLMFPIAPPASAQTVGIANPSRRVTIDIHVGSDLNFGRAITCSQGQRLIRNRGFRDVRRIDCRGRIFIYHATRANRRFEIALSARTGRVVDMRRIGRR